MYHTVSKCVNIIVYINNGKYFLTNKNKYISLTPIPVKGVYGICFRSSAKVQNVAVSIRTQYRCRYSTDIPNVHNTLISIDTYRQFSTKNIPLGKNICLKQKNKKRLQQA